VLVDPGPEVYTSRTFSKRRYDSNLLNSFGHPVPLVAGQLQQAGAQARARIVRTDFTDDDDTLVLDLTSAYDVPNLNKLERTFVYSRTHQGSLTVTDEATFSKPETFGTALITLGAWRELSDNRLRVEEGGQAVEVAISATGGKFRIRQDKIREDATIPRTPTRIGINFVKPAAQCTITLTIAPAGK
jgi:hypothetical protein